MSFKGGVQSTENSKIKRWNDINLLHSMFEHSLKDVRAKEDQHNSYFGYLPDLSL